MYRHSWEVSRIHFYSWSSVRQSSHKAFPRVFCVTLVSHACGRGFPQPHGIWYQRYTSIDSILYLFSILHRYGCKPMNIACAIGLAAAIYIFSYGQRSKYAVLSWTVIICFFGIRIWPRIPESRPSSVMVGNITGRHLADTTFYWIR